MPTRVARKTEPHGNLASLPLCLPAIASRPVHRARRFRPSCANLQAGTPRPGGACAPPGSGRTGSGSLRRRKRSGGERMGRATRREGRFVGRGAQCCSSRASSGTHCSRAGPPIRARRCGAASGSSPATTTFASGWLTTVTVSTRTWTPSSLCTRHGGAAAAARRGLARADKLSTGSSRTAPSSGAGYDSGCSRSTILQSPRGTGSVSAERSRITRRGAIRRGTISRSGSSCSLIRSVRHSRTVLESTDSSKEASPTSIGSRTTTGPRDDGVSHGALGRAVLAAMTVAPPLATIGRRLADTV